MINVAVCDDNIIVTKRTKEIIQMHEFKDELMIDTFSDGEELYKNAMNKKYEILLMDIELGQENKNGMSVSERIKAIYPDVIIIFLSGYPKYKSALLNFESFRFIQKPIKIEYLIQALEAAMERINGWKNNFFYYRSAGELVKIRIKKIMLLESVRPYIYIKTIDSETKLKYRGKLDEAQNEIEKISNDFLRVNRSILINKDYIQRCSKRELQMIDNEIITIGRKFAPIVNKYIMDFY